jgi:cell division protein FtsL
VKRRRRTRLGLAAVGRDLARAAPLPHGRQHLIGAALLGVLLAALLLATLRIDLIRVRYGLADAMREEKRLDEEQRRWTAQVQRLRNPTRLAQHAQELGLHRPDGVIELPASPSRRP